MKNRILLIIMVLTVFSVVQAQNPIITDVFTADPAPLVYNNTVYLYVGHDTAAVGVESYQMPDWLVYSTIDMVNWKSHGSCLKPSDFAWASHAANATHCIERDSKFYWYISVIHKGENGKGGVGIGVAVSNSPTGSFRDTIGKALITNDMSTDMPHSWDDLDPAAFIDDNGQAYLYWGNGSCKWVKLKENMIEIEGGIHTFKPENFTEAPWIYKRKELYYLVYAAGMPERVEYCIATSPEGPWTHQGILQDTAPNSFTTHPGIIDFKDKTYYFYHNGVLPTGGGYRRSVCVDYLKFNKDGTMQKVIQTTEGVVVVE